MSGHTMSKTWVIKLESWDNDVKIKQNLNNSA